jgi:hypothetical protein
MGAADPETGERVGLPWQYWRWQIAERFGWTLREVDALSMGDLAEWFEIEDARGKYHEARNPRK